MAAPNHKTVFFTIGSKIAPWCHVCVSSTVASTVVVSIGDVTHPVVLVASYSTMRIMWTAKMR